MGYGSIYREGLLADQVVVDWPHRLLEEVAMSLPRPPRAPAPVLFIRLAAQRVPESWHQYLPSLEQFEPAAA